MRYAASEIRYYSHISAMIDIVIAARHMKVYDKENDGDLMDFVDEIFAFHNFHLAILR